MHAVFQNPELTAVEKILNEHSLPVDDLSGIDLKHFFGCGSRSHMTGVIGLEIHGTDGLLRSLAVSADVQGKGCGSALLHKLEEHAQSEGIENLYLLTETAESYFKLNGFKTINREMASAPIKKTREFSELCPASATLMRKSL